MRHLPAIFAIAGLAMAAFGVWGSFTESGHRCFDEMDGMYPVFALIVAPFVLVAAWRCHVLVRRHLGKSTRGFAVEPMATQQQRDRIGPG